MPHNVNALGQPKAKRCFYLPNPPALPPDWQCEQPGSLDSLIALNGNHWRKILVIMAKICAPGPQWRPYLNLLLKHNEQIRFGAAQLSPYASEHFICGQQSAIALGLQPLTQPQQFSHQSLTAGQVYCLPHLDYRQCPNALIESLRQQLTQFD
ncbi:DUF6942 family protein [Shewanella sp.]|uniref:DUF6942 family protein n=1 Tax=Shewanella sp. TaxID=50422 RepID=UPI003D0C1634